MGICRCCRQITLVLEGLPRNTGSTKSRRWRCCPIAVPTTGCRPDYGRHRQAASALTHTKRTPSVLPTGATRVRATPSSTRPACGRCCARGSGDLPSPRRGSAHEGYEQGQQPLGRLALGEPSDFRFGQKREALNIHRLIDSCPTPRVQHIEVKRVAQTGEPPGRVAPDAGQAVVHCPFLRAADG